MSKTHRRQPYGRKHVPPGGGAMRAKQDKRRQTRQALEQEWLAEWQEEQEAAWDALQAISDEAEGR